MWAVHFPASVRGLRSQRTVLKPSGWEAEKGLDASPLTCVVTLLGTLLSLSLSTLITAL